MGDTFARAVLFMGLSFLIISSPVWILCFMFQVAKVWAYGTRVGNQKFEQNTKGDRNEEKQTTA